MGYESTEGRERAYVALPVPPEDGLTLALKWCFGQDSVVGWESIGILAPDPALIDNTPVLRRYRTRGLMVTARSAELSTPRSLEGFTGPLVAYRPDAPTLELAEAVSGAGGIVAVSGNNDWLSSWITAHQPAHLAGARLDPARP